MRFYSYLIAAFFWSPKIWKKKRENRQSSIAIGHARLCVICDLRQFLGYLGAIPFVNCSVSWMSVAWRHHHRSSFFHWRLVGCEPSRRKSVFKKTEKEHPRFFCWEHSFNSVSFTSYQLCFLMRTFKKAPPSLNFWYEHWRNLDLYKTYILFLRTESISTPPRYLRTFLDSCTIPCFVPGSRGILQFVAVNR